MASKDKVHEAVRQAMEIKYGYGWYNDPTEVTQNIAKKIKERMRRNGETEIKVATTHEFHFK